MKIPSKVTRIIADDERLCVIGKCLLESPPPESPPPESPPPLKLSPPELQLLSLPLLHVLVLDDVHELPVADEGGSRLAPTSGMVTPPTKYPLYITNSPYADRYF